MAEILNLKNPHSILMALQKRPKDVKSISLPKGRSGEGWEEIEALAHKLKIPARADEIKGGNRGGEHGARVVEKASVTFSELFEDVPKRGLFLALDEVQDPQNVGAIFRTAAFFGVHGILMTEHRSAGLTAASYDVASGGVECVPHATVVNLQQAFEYAKEKGIWVLGTSEHAETTYADIDRDRCWLLALGNEEKGLRKLTLEQCDETCTIPSKGGVGSLNVANAASILISSFSIA